MRRTDLLEVLARHLANLDGLHSIAQTLISVVENLLAVRSQFPTYLRVLTWRFSQVLVMGYFNVSLSSTNAIATKYGNFIHLGIVFSGSTDATHLKENCVSMRCLRVGKQLWNTT